MNENDSPNGIGAKTNEVGVRTEEGLPLTARQLIEVGNPDTSTDPFVREVRKFLELSKEEFDQKLNAASGGPISTGVDIYRLREMIVGQPVSGYGFISSSVGYDHHKEIIWASAIGRFFRDRNNQSDQPTRPIQLVVVPIDIFSRYLPGNASLVTKVLRFQEETLEDEHDYAIILTGFTESSVFTEAVISSIPNSVAAGLKRSATDEPSEFQNKIAETYRQAALILEKEKGDINSAIRRLTAESKGGNEEDAKLLMASYLLSRDPLQWQSLPEMNEGVGLFIVAPLSLHHAILRIGHGLGDHNMNYMYRADRGTYGAWREPLSDSNLAIPDINLNQGLSPGDFEARMNPFII